MAVGHFDYDMWSTRKKSTHEKHEEWMLKPYISAMQHDYFAHIFFT